MAGFTRITTTNARSAVASRALVADGNGKTQPPLLPSAARRRSFRSGFVPAVALPALHFAARRTADRSSSSGTRPALHRTLRGKWKSAASNANPRRTTLRRNRRRKPARAVKPPALSSDATQGAIRPMRTNLMCLVRERMKGKIECCQASRHHSAKWQ